MAKHPLGPGSRYVEHRSGLGGFVWGGVVGKVDPGASPPNRPRFLTNTRIQGGSIVSRADYGGPGALIPPLTRYSSNQSGIDFDKQRLPAEIYNSGGNYFGQGTGWTPVWAAEFNSVGGGKLWWGSVPAQTYTDLGGWVTSYYGGEFGFIDVDNDPVLNRVATYPNADSWPPCIERWAGQLYIGDFGCLRRVNLIQPPPGQAPADMLDAPGDEIVFEYPGYRTTHMCEYRGMLWLLITDPTGVDFARLYSYDGMVAVEEHVFPVSGDFGGVLKPYKNQLVITLSGAGDIYWRNPDGTYGTATAVDFDSSPYLNSMVEYKDMLVIMDGLDTLWGFDGATLTKLHQINPAVSPWNGEVTAPAYAYCCCVMNDILYYTYTDTFTVAAVTCTGTLTYAGQPMAGTSIEVYGQLYFFNDTYPLNDWEVYIDSTEDATFTNLKNAINRTWPPTPIGQNHEYGKYNIPTANTGFTATIDTGTNTITLTGKNPGTYLNGTVASNTGSCVVAGFANGVDAIDPHVCLGKYDADNAPANQFDDFYNHSGYLMVPNPGALYLPSPDWAVTAMAFHKGRIWLAVSGVPFGNSFVMTHFQQYAAWDGWFICDSVAIGQDVDEVGYGSNPMYGHGPGHGSYDFNWTTTPQMYFFRSL